VRRLCVRQLVLPEQESRVSLQWVLLPWAQLVQLVLRQQVSLRGRDPPQRFQP
jgi:hypothetical protein